jgi:hypothetical protein
MMELNSNARRYIGKSIAPGTQTRRSKILTKFKTYLEGRVVFDGKDIINYLADLPQKMMPQFFTIRTAINTTIHQNAGYNFSEDLLFKKLSKGVMKEFPLDPKYDEMWDLRVLFKHLKSMSMERQRIDMRTKANILVRTSIAGRNGDVAFIHRKSIKWDEASVRFRFFQWKTQCHTAMRFSNYFSVAKQSETALCPYNALKEYMALHEKDYESLDCDGIWLNYRGNAEVKPATLANCARKEMKEAGIDELYGAGTIRHATITFWRDNGIPMEKVIERTQHKSTKLVLKFYDKSCTKLDIMADILDEWDDCEEGQVGEASEDEPAEDQVQEGGSLEA